MPVVKLTVGYDTWPYRGLRQSPGGAGWWGDVRFAINEDVDECDGWVVLQSEHGLLREETTRCPPENVILITREPEEMMTWPQEYCAQFAKVITSQQALVHPHKLLTQHGQVWHFNRKTYDELKVLPPVAKPGQISVIASAKRATAGHRARLEFIENLAKTPGVQLDRFGRGIRPIDDKWDAIARYQFHIVMENSQHPHYWTEKLTDCYLAYAFPIYWGAPNIHEYFPESALLQIDISDQRRAIDCIRELITTHHYEDLLPQIIQARSRVLDYYNLLPTILRHLEVNRTLQRRTITLHPAFEFDSISVAEAHSWPL
jgi:hypothetical protein